MVNPYRGEMELVVDGEARVMRLTLGTLAELEDQLGSTSLLGLIERFETGAFATSDLIALLTAGLRGGGWDITREDLLSARVEGGPLGAAKAAAALLKLTFSIPGDDAK